MDKRKTGILIILALSFFLSVRAHSFNYLPAINLPVFSSNFHHPDHANWHECDHFFPSQLIPIKSIHVCKTGLLHSHDQEKEVFANHFIPSRNNFPGGKNYLSHIYHSHHFW